jgi:hypothetical protein
LSISSNVFESVKKNFTDISQGRTIKAVISKKDEDLDNNLQNDDSMESEMNESNNGDQVDDEMMDDDEITKGRYCSCYVWA